jgi:hypothetical protein
MQTVTETSCVGDFRFLFAFAFSLALVLVQ